MSAAKAEAARAPNHAEAAAFRVDLMYLLLARHGQGGVTVADVMHALGVAHPWLGKQTARGLISDVLHWGWAYSTGGKIPETEEKFHIAAMGQTILALHGRS